MDRRPCPQCGKLLVLPTGNLKSKVLLVGEFAGYEEVKNGTPFVGRAGDVLKYELQRAGLQMNTCRLTNLWLHDKDEKGCDPGWHLDQLVKEFVGRTHILLMGSDTIHTLTGKSVSDVQGLRVKVDGFSKVHFWASPNPAIVFHAPVGELRLAIARFVEDIKS